MANVMRTFVEVKNYNERVVGFIKNLTTPISISDELTTIDIINRLYGTTYNWDYELKEGNWPASEFMNEFVGSRWINIEQDIIDDNQCRFNIETHRGVPVPFLQNLAEKLSNIKDDIYIIGTYEDEMYAPIGAFVFGKGYEDIEDYDDTIDADRMWDDIEYQETIFNELSYHRDLLETAYLEYSIDKKNHLEDYE